MPKQGKDASVQMPLLKPIAKPCISAKSWVVIDAATGMIIEGKCVDLQREIASLTKIMTFMVVIDLVNKYSIDLEKTYTTISCTASLLAGTTASLQEGETTTLADLLYGMMLPSGNDAATALAEFFGPYAFREQLARRKPAYVSECLSECKNPIKCFVSEMNARAVQLNLKNTHFYNPHGFSMHTVNKSTAYDVALLSHYAIAEPLVQKVISKKMYFCRSYKGNGTFINHFWENTNRLLYYGFRGVKTGFTSTAGPCLSSWYQNKEININLIIVLLASKSMESRWQEGLEILQWQIYKTSRWQMKQLVQPTSLWRNVD